MSFWVPAAITAGTSLLGHAMQRREGGPPSDAITDRMEEIGEQGTQDFDRMLSAANEGAGFQALANDRQSRAMGMPGAMTARNQQMGSEARGQAFETHLTGRQQRNQMLNQLAGQLQQADMNQWQHRQNMTQNLATGLGGAMAQGFSDRQANIMHENQMRQQDEMNSMLQQIIESAVSGRDDRLSQISGMLELGAGTTKTTPTTKAPAAPSSRY